MVPPSELDIGHYNGHTQLTLSITSLCHSKQASALNSRNVIVFGASSFLGSNIVARTHSDGYKVYSVEDILNRRIDPYTWKRWDKLVSLGYDPWYLNTSSNSEVQSLLNKAKSGTIVYIPDLLFDGVSKQSKPSADLQTLASSLRNFVSLLKLIANDHKGQFRVVLVSLSNSAGLSVQKAWLNAFEFSLSSYQKLHELEIGILRVNGVYGQWEGDEKVQRNSSTCLHIRQLEDQLLTMNRDFCEEWEIVGHCHTESTSIIDESNLKRNVIMSTYFTKKGNSMYAIVPNKFLFMKQWFLSARKFGAFLVIFHDQLSIEFQERVKQFYPSVEFVKQDSLHGWSANDGRFYMEYDYLLQHPEIDRVLLTDMRDVKFFGDPFQVMKVIGDYVYVGIDVTYLVYSYELKWIRDIWRVCSKHEDHSYMELHPFLNAGVLGGTRHATLSYLVLMNHYLKTTPKFNCNMAAINFVTNKFFHEVSYTGYPLQQGFKLGTAPSTGLAVKHKDTGELNLQ